MKKDGSRRKFIKLLASAPVAAGIGFPMLSANAAVPDKRFPSNLNLA